MKEYREALEDENYLVASRIMRANPELRDELQEALSNVPNKLVKYEGAKAPCPKPLGGS